MNKNVGQSSPWWQTDFSLIKALERDNIKPMENISHAKAAVLLQPLLGTCHSKDVDIW